MDNVINNYGKGEIESTLEWYERLIGIGAPPEVISSVRDILMFQTQGISSYSFILFFVRIFYNCISYLDARTAEAQAQARIAEAQAKAQARIAEAQAEAQVRIAEIQAQAQARRSAQTKPEGSRLNILLLISHTKCSTYLLLDCICRYFHFFLFQSNHYHSLSI